MMTGWNSHSRAECRGVSANRAVPGCREAEWPCSAWGNSRKTPSTGWFGTEDGVISDFGGGGGVSIQAGNATFLGHYINLYNLLPFSVTVNSPKIMGYWIRKKLHGPYRQKFRCAAEETAVWEGYPRPHSWSAKQATLNIRISNSQFSVLHSAVLFDGIPNILICLRLSCFKIESLTSQEIHQSQANWRGQSHPVENLWHSVFIFL